MSINYETVQGPNYAAYANPGFGMALGQMLQGLPDQYMKGREARQQVQAQDAFKNPEDWQDKNGNPDPDKVLAKGIQIGGIPFAHGLMPFMLDLKAGQQWANAIPGGGGDSSPAPRPNNPNAAGPANLTGGSQPRFSSNGSDVGDGPGGTTIRSMATEFAGGDRDATALISGAVRTLRISPDKPLNADQAAQVKGFLSQSPKPFKTSEDITSAPGSPP
jgi:hypothetical protein